MKKCGTYLIIIFAAILTACNEGSGSATKGKDKYEFVTKSLKTETLIDSANSRSPKYELNISIHVAESENKSLEENINTTVENAIFGYGGIPIETAMDSFATATREEYLSLRPEYFNIKQMNENPGWLNYACTIETGVEHGRSGTINYSIFSYYNTGGAHPNTMYTFINFDPATGEEIKLTDIFKENYEEFLNNKLTDALADKIGATGREDIKEKGYLIFNDIYPTENFILKSDSILFFYNRYDIAPYALGTTTLGFTYDELSSIMK